MRWPYNARIDKAHAWGTVGSGITIAAAVAGALASLHTNDPHFRWWWPTSWMIVPVGIVLIGLIMVLVPLRRDDDQSKEGRERTPELRPIRQTIEQNITAEAPGATAQGAVHGNVINYGKQSGNGAPDPAATESADHWP
jgi:hypothetical protein